MAAHKLALASRKADITVGIQAEHYPASIANPLGSGNSFGIALQMPLLARSAFAGEIRAADIAVDNARANLDKTRAIVRSEALVANARARAAFERVRRYRDELLPLARKAADSAEYAFAHGALGIMDLLDLRRTFRIVQLEAIGARADYAKSLAPARAAALEEVMQ
jgi:cobalt-zinc-cadmium efflux system outer membrane protein